MTIFEHRDGDGDLVEIRTRPLSPEQPLILTATDRHEDEDTEVSVYLSRDAITRLRAALTSYDDEATAASETGVVIETGREYRLLPDATFTRLPSYGIRHTYPSAFDEKGTTRVRVIAGPDSDGDYEVRAVDGEQPDRVGYVAPRFLAPLEASTAEPAWKVDDEAIIAVDEPSYAPLFKGDRVRVVSIPEREDGLYVAFVSGRGEPYDGARGWFVLTDQVRRPDPDPEPTVDATAAVVSLDQRRLAALTFAAELAGKGILGVTPHEAVLGYALFLLNELPTANGAAA
ncbi:hypothetical protein Acy02nite_68250 [Actinoplanes cyaneus]|uniref:Uncharacterized protein n=1 Tax=Actinoplanes cyaneus TaxID=52696 RepID=A0A919MAU4_9ACTN|nr:hypothetical protein [Actinoplanes cyaneus]MCW2139122.1 hypothetical protein [Actinoplanes cyaneus]GID68944.1 hypothetical protein Acy02nite_68250 [Actinoplanes cyaneus]